MRKTVAKKENTPLPSSGKKPVIEAWRRFKDWCELIKVEHTVFALPFALSGLVLASKHLPGPALFFWTALAFAGARAAAMSLNRVIDAKIDAKNKRTSQRAIPKGLINKRSAILFAIISFLFMILAAAQLPPLCLELSPIAILWLTLYSFMKRFTWLCHFVLGIALGGAALGGWLAAGGEPTAAPAWILALAVSTWVAGFDIIYACLDVDFDRQEKIQSIPARFGLSKALALSSALHVVTMIALVGLGWSLKLGSIYFTGVAFATMALIWEHTLVSASDLSKANAAFFNINGLVSILVFMAILFDRLFRP